MKKLSWLITLATAGLVAAGLSFAAEVEEEVTLEVVGEGEAIAVDASDLEVGEVRQLFTDSGKEVLLSRTDEGYEVEVDGKKIDIGHLADGDRLLHQLEEEGEEGAARVFVVGGACEGCRHHKTIRVGPGDLHGFRFDLDETEGHKVVFMTGGDEAAVKRHMGVKVLGERPDLVAHVREKGILDKLDDDLREELIAALEDYEAGGIQWLSTSKILLEEESDDDE